MKSKILLLSTLVLILIIVIFVSTGCNIECMQTHRLNVINDSGNTLPFHASTDGEVGSNAPKIEPGNSHTFQIDIRESHESTQSPHAFLTISRDGEVLSEELIYFDTLNVDVTIYEAITGGVVSEVEYN